MQRPFLVEVGLIDGDVAVDPIQPLLREALSAVVFIPWSAGVMTHFEHDLYSDLDSSSYNDRWWEYKTLYQGIVPPEGHLDGSVFDGGSKTHITDDPAGYYDYAISYILLFHLHDYIAREILHEDPRATNYYGQERVGEFLWSILSQGSKAEWRTLLAEKTGQDLSAQAMLDYYAPLMIWLKEQNEGRTYTLEPIEDKE
jgi:peptidyl-dipeptidase A